MWTLTSLRSRLPGSRRWSIIVGACLLNFPAGINHCYGNLSIYTDSYLIHKEGVMNFTNGSLWFISLMMINFAIGTFAGGLLAKRIGPRPTVMLSSLLFNLAIFMTYFAVQRSFWCLALTYGVCGGLFTGINDVMGIQYAATWFPDNVAVATSVITSAYTIGALMLNLIITLYANPNDKAPDFHTGKSTYFTDEDILSRVPSVFLVIGVVSSVCQIAGVSLLKPHPGFSPFGKTDDAVFQANPQNEIVEYTYLYGPNESDSVLHYVSENELTGHGSEEKRRPEELSGSNAVEQLNLTTRQLLTSWVFYKVCVAFMSILFALIVADNFYKQFGIIYINDDYFLTSIGALNSITFCVSRLVWGFIVKTINPKNSYVLMSSAITILYVFWFFTPMVNKWVFLFWTLTIQATESGLIISSVMLVLKFFGSTHHINNYGAVFVSSIVILVLSPPIVDSVLENFGYFWVFLLISLINCLSLFLALSFPSIS